jgi:2,3,4,5-tetrahydropyridine-2-carboxylate N-succinyltransferase
MDAEELQRVIESIWQAPTTLSAPASRDAVEDAIDRLDKGSLRIATRGEAQAWTVHEWLKKAILLYFRLRGSEISVAGPCEYYDKVPLKHGWDTLGVRVVPPAVARFGSYVSPGVILMPSFVNIGAWVGPGTMVDTWATVGSCAQIGANVHLAGGVGIGGVLEPMQARPVIVEDGAFIGSRAVLTEGVLIGEQAIIAPNVSLTGTVPIIDVTGPEPVEYRGYVPPRAIVVPGTRMKRFPAGEYHLNAAIIIGQRSASSDLKVSLNEALREHGIG